jgi:hypothetical protein
MNLIKTWVLRVKYCKDKDTIYVIQERQTSRIQVDERNFITPDKGGAAYL